MPNVIIFHTRSLFFPQHTSKNASFPPCLNRPVSNIHVLLRFPKMRVAFLAEGDKQLLGSKIAPLNKDRTTCFRTSVDVFGNHLSVQQQGNS